MQRIPWSCLYVVSISSFAIVVVYGRRLMYSCFCPVQNKTKPTTSNPRTLSSLSLVLILCLDPCTSVCYYFFHLHAPHLTVWSGHRQACQKMSRNALRAPAKSQERAQVKGEEQAVDRRCLCLYSSHQEWTDGLTGAPFLTNKPLLGWMVVVERHREFGRFIKRPSAFLVPSWLPD